MMIRNRITGVCFIENIREVDIEGLIVSKLATLRQFKLPKQFSDDIFYTAFDGSSYIF